MSKALRTCPLTWNGTVLLACRKCQKKLKSNPDRRALSRLKQSIKARNKQHPGARLHLIGVSCMDLCPKDGVTIHQPSIHPDRLAILYDESDIDQLYPAS